MERGADFLVVGRPLRQSPHPAAVPRGIVERLNAAVLKALALRDVREKFESLGSEVAPSTPEAFGEWIRAETTKWGRVIRERKITLD